MPLSYMDLRGRSRGCTPTMRESVFKAMGLTIMIETVPLKRLLEEDVITILKARSPSWKSCVSLVLMWSGSRLRSSNTKNGASPSGHKPPW